MERSTNFREQLLQRLTSHESDILLRIALAPNFDSPLTFTGAQIVQESLALVRTFAPAKKHGVVLLLLPHCPELFLLHIGLVLDGYVPAILAWPTSRVDPEKYQRNLLHQLKNMPADHLITLPRLANNLGPDLPYSVAGCAIESAAAFEKLFPVAPVSEQLTSSQPATGSARPDPDALFLQFSGGTTGAQKAVVVTAPMLTQQLSLLAEALDLSTRDHVVSWLPMYHDMGLIACLWFALWNGIPSLQLGANDWVMKPELLFHYISRYAGTLCWLPNFAFSYLSHRREQMAGPYKLEQVRAWINCSEPVRRRSMISFAEAFEEWGVRRESLQASYAMAESVFAVTQTKLQVIPPAIPRSQIRSSAQQYKDLAYDLIDDVFVSSGRTLPATEVRIVNPAGGPCPDGEPGEIYIRTPCLFSGYWGSDGFKTHSLSADGWHATGDYGFMKDGELFVIGRLKDIVIIGGQNVFPEDVEAVVNTLDGVYPGRVVAFGIEDREYGTESLAIVAETRVEYTQAIGDALEAEIRKLVAASIGIAPRYVIAVPQRWIVKSTAGKISRRETRERFLRERTVQRKAEVA